MINNKIHLDGWAAEVNSTQGTKVFLLFFFEKNEYIPHIAFNYLASEEKLGERNEYTFTLHYKYTGVIAINIVIELSLLHMNNAAKYINRLTI